MLGSLRRTMARGTGRDMSDTTKSGKLRTVGWVRRISLGSLAVIGAAVLLVLILGFDLMTPFEPKAPPLAQVTPDTFRFENYGRQGTSLKRALEKLFPTGTPKQYVDSILVQRAGAACPSCATAAERAKKGDGLVVY